MVTTLIRIIVAPRERKVIASTEETVDMTRKGAIKGDGFKIFPVISTERP